ncbi:MHS family MFS transporter [Wolbachia pipientis]|uniref:MHS family MFS transporter n=1 Tax=Wolbachia pipientis TaxID=955 RepID=A0A6H2NUR5_WOLPI|nr:MFS transporter [Wolbachia endosymbiont of Aedes albopictus]TVS90676.1 MHS family MFS transporter [Wolbachia pipientis]TVS98842.1 MHS family MFS transporter [Wolbachia pipientis]UVW83764.1 MFS transporter [Wolbachia endosymbiont of Aedes albopictus]
MQQITKVIFSSLICNTLLWYDHMLFSHLISIIGDVFFPSDDKLVSILKAFGVFAVGFLIRPIGAAIFGYIGDKYGRKIALFLSIILMTLSTVLIAFVPGYQSIGILASMLVVCLRLLQGISLGGEAGNAPFLIEHAPKNKKGFFGSIEVLSAILGSILSLIAVLICKKVSDFESWGWRLPFIFSLAMGLISIYMRYILDESPEYKRQEKRSELPLKELLNGYRKPFLISVGVDIVENSSLYIYLVFFNVLTSTINTQFNHTVEILNQVALGGLTILFAMLSDKIGRAKVMKFAFVTFIVVSYPVFSMILSGDNLLTIMAHVLFIIPIAASLGPVSAFMCELFPTRVRYSGFGLSRNIASGFFGGLAPFICTTIIKVTGQETSASFYMIFCALIGLVAISQIKD